MPFSITSAQGKQTLKLEGSVTIRQAQELAAKITQCLEDDKQMTVDTTDLDDIDTCILQVLCSLRKTVPGLCFDNASDAFMSAIDRCGLRRELLSVREGL